MSEFLSSILSVFLSHLFSRYFIFINIHKNTLFCIISEYLLYIQGVLFLIMPVARVIFSISEESSCLWYFISDPLCFFLKIQFFISCHFFSTLRTSFSIFCSVDLLVFFQWKGLLVFCYIWKWLYFSFVIERYFHWE